MCKLCDICFLSRACARNFRAVVRQPGVNDRGQNLNPITKAFSDVPNDINRVYVCRRCRDSSRNRSVSLQRYVPTASPEYCKALVSIPFEALHSTSFIDVSFKLTTAATGYVTGQFAPNSLLQSPLLVAQEAHPEHTFDHHLQFIKDELTSFNTLYPHYIPLWSTGDQHTTALPARTFQHILHSAQGCGPVTDRHEHHNNTPAILGVYSDPSATQNTTAQASVGTVAPVAGVLDELVPVLPSASDVMYKTGRAVQDALHTTYCSTTMPRQRVWSIQAACWWWLV